MVPWLLKSQNNDWVQQMKDPNVNFYTVQQSFEQYWENKEIEKGKGWKQFKRWEAFWAPRVYPEGIRPNTASFGPSLGFLSSQSEDWGDWKPIGPFVGNQLNGVGRINNIAFDPADANQYWVSTPAGGLWKTVDNGQNWVTTTDQFPNLGISDIVINPKNPQVIYLATGDKDGGDTYSYGILKSVNGGETWATTGLANSVTQQIQIMNLLIHPNHPDTLLASTNSGIYRTINGGGTWTRTLTGSFGSMVQKEGKPNVLFCSTFSGSLNHIYQSTNNGISWSKVSHNTLPQGNTRRIELATSPNDSNCIYALYGNSVDNGFLGVYRSLDGGQSWAQQATSPNLLGWQANGQDVGGQAWYDLAIEVNPTDKDHVWVGGVNIWESTDGGVNWNIASHWNRSGGLPFVHADVHSLRYHPQTLELYACTDGGLYRDIDAQFNWDHLNNGLNITQYYKMGASALDTGIIIAGAQDNGTHLKNGASWSSAYGGDGMDCAISTKNSNVMYASIYYGDFRKSINGGFSFNPINLPPAGSGNWVTPLALDPKHPDTLYVGFNSLWKSTNGGASFNALGTSSISGAGKIDVIAIGPENTNIVCIADGKNLFKSEDYGKTWQALNSLPGSRAITGIAINALNPENMMVTKSGYLANEKVFESFDGGGSWQNISAGLPNVPINCLELEHNSANGLYIGTDIGIYYRDDILNQWLRFSKQLPNTIVNDLEINFKNRQLRAATYGRGLWQSKLYSDLVQPIAEMQIPQNACIGDTLIFEPITTYNATSYKWKISPATFQFVNGTSANSEFPEITFLNNGFYDVSLTSANQAGSDSVFKFGAIAVGGYPISFSDDFDGIFESSKWGIYGWELISTADGNHFKAPVNNSNTGSKFELISPPFNTLDHDSVWLKLDHAYSGSSTVQTDSLLIFAARSCSNIWQLVTTIVEDGSQNFVTAPGQNNQFIPATNDWCANCINIDLTSFANEEGLRIKIVAVSSGGNNIYLDNFVLNGNPTTPPSSNFSSVRKSCALDTVLFLDQSYGSPKQWLWGFDGPDQFTSHSKNPKIRFNKSGVYQVSLKTTNANGSDSIQKGQYITIDAADSVTFNLNYNQTSICSSDTLWLQPTVNNVGANPTYIWYKNRIKLGTSKTLPYPIVNLKHNDTLYAALYSDALCAYPKVLFSDTIFSQIHSVTQLQFTPTANHCITDGAYSLLASPPGGIFSGHGVTNQLFYPSTAGTGSHQLYYTYIDTNGCETSISANIKVHEPTQIILGSNFSFCLGDAPTTLNMAYPAGGQYSGLGVANNILFLDSLKEGIHNITYTYQSLACGVTSKTFSIPIVAPDTPQVLIGNNILYCSIKANMYQWYDSNNDPVSGANGQVFIPQTNGQYRVDVLDTNGCFAQSHYQDFFVGIEEIPTDVDFELFPNPTKDQLFINLNGTQKRKITIRIYNSVGALQWQKTTNFTNPLQTAISLLPWPAGPYHILIQSDDILISRKVIKH